MAVLASFNLKKGDCLGDDEISDVLLAEERKHVKESAYRYLSGRAHSEKELRTKLLRKDYSENLVDAVLEEFKVAKLIDDREFALAFARSRILNKPMGERLLRQDLWRKGISEPLIEHAVKDAYSEHPQLEVALKLLEKRQSRYKDLQSQDRRKRLYDLLMRRGFGWDVAGEALNSLANLHNEE